MASKLSLCVSHCVMHCGLRMSRVDAFALIFENSWPPPDGQPEVPISIILGRIPEELQNCLLYVLVVTSQF